MIAELYLDQCTGELQMYVTPTSDTEDAMMAQHAHRFGMHRAAHDLSYRTGVAQAAPNVAPIMPPAELP